MCDYSKSSFQQHKDDKDLKKKKNTSILFGPECCSVWTGLGMILSNAHRRVDLLCLSRRFPILTLLSKVRLQLFLFTLTKWLPSDTNLTFEVPEIVEVCTSEVSFSAIVQFIIQPSVVQAVVQACTIHGETILIMLPLSSPFSSSSLIRLFACSISVSFSCRCPCCSLIYEKQKGRRKTSRIQHFVTSQAA